MAATSAGELLRRLPNIFVRSLFWNTALFVCDPDYEPGEPLSGPPVHLFRSKRLWRGRREVFTRADPFLWVEDDRLYLFLEAEPELGDGYIEIWRTHDLSSFERVEVLREPYHLSYPFVFSHEGATYLMPESSAGNGVFLYKFDEFPERPRKFHRLLEGPYVDSSLIRHDEVWYLFTSNAAGELEIHVSRDLLKEDFRPHPANPISADPRFSRSGGGVLRTRGGLVRLAQDCSERYGKNLNLLEISKLTPEAYSERLLQQDMFPLTEEWNRWGVHHLSLARFRGRTVVAIDGREQDFYVHRFRALACRALRL